MYDRVLIPLDGTPLAEQALVHAASLARRAGAELHVVTVRLDAPATLPEAPRAPELENVESDYLEAVAGGLREAGVSSVSTRVLEGSEVVERLEAYRQEVGADVTVMSTHGRGPLRRVWMGSVADRFLRSSGAPIWLVRPEEPEDEGETEVDLTVEPGIRRVLVPLDGSDASEQALAPALEICRRYEAACTLVRVVPSIADVESVWFENPFEVAGVQLEAARKAAQGKLDSIAERVRGAGIAVEAAAILAPHSARGILEYAEEIRADLIAMATHGRGGVARVVLGSVADKVIRGAECPVLAVPPGAA